MEDLVGAAEIARRLGYRRAVYVHDLRRRYKDFPEPVAKMGSSFAWSWPEVEAWAKATGRLK